MPLRLDDDGQCVTLDLHGATVEEAVTLARRTVREAARRGRATVRLIHGTSTSHRHYRNRTIKHALHELADQNGFGSAVAGALRSESVLTLSLGIQSHHKAARLRLRDVM